MTGEALKTTPLSTAHAALGARMTPFAGYAMPVQYDFSPALAARCRGGVMAEHLHCRTQAALFDIPPQPSAPARKQPPRRRRPSAPRK